MGAGLVLAVLAALLIPSVRGLGATVGEPADGGIAVQASEQEAV
jgi:hypothetical protein